VRIYGDGRGPALSSGQMGNVNPDVVNVINDIPAPDVFQHLLVGHRRVVVFHEQKRGAELGGG